MYLKGYCLVETLPRKRKNGGKGLDCLYIVCSCFCIRIQETVSPYKKWQLDCFLLVFLLKAIHDCPVIHGFWTVKFVISCWVEEMDGYFFHDNMHIHLYQDNSCPWGREILNSWLVWTIELPELKSCKRMWWICDNNTLTYISAFVCEEGLW